MNEDETHFYSFDSGVFLLFSGRLMCPYLIIIIYSVNERENVLEKQKKNALKYSVVWK